MCAYRRVAWMKLLTWVKAGSLTKDKATKLFQFNFGAHDKVCLIGENALTMNRMPPEPD